MKRWGRIGGAAALVLAPWLMAATTAYIQQSGVVTYSHLAAWAAPGVLMDAGTSDSGIISTLGILANGGTPFCLNSAPVGQPRLKFCLAVQNGVAATMSLYSYNGEAIVPFQLNINGTIYPFPLPPGSLGVFRQISSGSSDTASTLDGNLAWNSATALAKTESLYACSTGSKGNLLTVSDEKGTAGTYPITLSPSGGNTINNASTYIMAFNNQSVTMVCDGAGNWIVQ